MQYSYSKEMCTGKVKPIRITGDPDNQCPDKRSSAILVKRVQQGAYCLAAYSYLVDLYAEATLQPPGKTKQYLQGTFIRCDEVALWH